MLIVAQNAIPTISVGINLELSDSKGFASILSVLQSDSLNLGVEDLPCFFICYEAALKKGTFCTVTSLNVLFMHFIRCKNSKAFHIWP